MAGGTDKQPLGAGLGMAINLSNCSGNLVGSSEVEGSKGLCNLHELFPSRGQEFFVVGGPGYPAEDSRCSGLWLPGLGSRSCWRDSKATLSAVLGAAAKFISWPSEFFQTGK